MHIPRPHHRGTHHSSSSSSGGARHELLDNPITYEIVLMIAVVSLAMLLVGAMRCLQSCIAPDDDYCYEYEYQQEYDEDARPWSLTLTADGDLVDESGGKHRQYGTFWYPAHGRWFSADGVELSYDEWIQTVYDPLD